MSILIKGMEMPTNCFDCKMRMAIGCIGVLQYQNTRMPNCPLVSIPPHGKWVLKTFDDGYGEYQLYECNRCGAVTAQRKSKNYCHNCGARMVEDVR